MNFLKQYIVDNFKKWWSKKKTAHPSISFIVTFVIKLFKEYRLNKQKTFKSFFLLLFKFYVIIEYIQCYFFTYNILGNFIILANGVFLIASTSHLVNNIGLFVISYYVASAITFYFLIQFSLSKKLMLELLGIEAFSYYIGTNTGTEFFKKVGAVIGTSYIVALASVKTHLSVDTADAVDRTNAYIELCDKANVAPCEQSIVSLVSHRTPFLDFPFLPSIVQKSPEVVEAITKVSES